MIDVIAGEPDFHFLVNPYSIATDSHGRVIVTDTGADGVHVFDFTEKKYKFLSRKDNGKDPMLSPQCVAVDAEDNIYVTDSQAGKIFIYDAKLKFRRVIRSLKGGEGYFKRPTGIAVDSAAQRIFITDTLCATRSLSWICRAACWRPSAKPALPKANLIIQTELRLNGAELFVVDAKNFRVQALIRFGTLSLYSIGKDWRPGRIDVSPQGNQLRFRRTSLRRR